MVVPEMSVVIIGGGIVGMASAYRLARDGVDVTVCERSKPGAGSTERALGGIRAQFSTPGNIALSQHAMAVWERFEDAFGIDIGFRQHGYLFLTDDESTAEAFERRVDLQREHGVPSEYLAPEAAREYLPALHADRYVAATYSPTDGTADPHLALQGFADAARESGADVRTEVEVTDIEFQPTGSADPHVVAVDTNEGRIGCEYVVNAAGPWARRVGRLADLSLPVAPKRRQIAVVEPSTACPEDVPLTVDVGTGVHFTPERAGDALVAGHVGQTDPDHDPDAYPTDYDLDWVTAALSSAGDIAGYFGAESRVKNGWAGLYAVTPDHRPIIEESRPGFVNAVGFSGHGFMHSPATAQVVADLVTRGTTDIVELDPFRSDRFDDGDATPETAVL